MDPTTAKAMALARDAIVPLEKYVIGTTRRPRAKR
jgi:hypothetical protein